MAYIRSENIREIWHRKNGLWHKIGEAFHGENGVFRKVFSVGYSLIADGNTELQYRVNQCYVDSNLRGSITGQDGYLQLRTAGSGDSGVGYGFSYLIDLTEYSKIHIELKRTGDRYNRPLLIVSSSTGNVASKKLAELQTVGTYDRQILTLDISSIAGEKYVTVYAGGNGATANAVQNIYNLWLE